MWKAWKSLLSTLQQSIDITTAVLLLTGQLTVRSIIFSIGSEFRLSVTGPILGGPRAVPVVQSPGIAFGIDATDVFLALLLILEQIQVIGLFIQTGRLSLLIGGPVFGSRRIVPNVPGQKN
ncbi:hypothetical protein, partial [Tumebacillus flagellatus]|uniref:Uncharacterized protein n=1 Tax=Tumebacillus flagellatus TaxID=1157490 RepID=A0A074LMG0_9BACL